MSLMLLHFVQFEEVKVNLTHADAFKSGCFYCNHSYFTWINCIFFLHCFSLCRLCFNAHIWWWVFAFLVLFVSKILYVRIFDDDNEQKLAVPSISKYNDCRWLNILPTKTCSFESKIACLKMCGFLNHPNGMDVDEFFGFFFIRLPFAMNYNSIQCTHLWYEPSCLSNGVFDIEFHVQKKNCIKRAFVGF